MHRSADRCVKPQKNSISPHGPRPFTCVRTTLLRSRRRSPVRGNVHPQVMSAQPPVPSPPTLEGEVDGPQYGSVQQEQREIAARQDPPANTAVSSTLVVNGVDPRREGAARESPLPAKPRVAEPPREGHARTDERAGTTMMAEDIRSQVNQGTVVSPSSSAGYESLPTRPSSPHRPQSGQLQEAERTVAMEYSFQQQAGGQPVVRWVARLTEFLRSSTRGNGLQGRVLEGLGLGNTTAQQPSGYSTFHEQQPHPTPEQQQLALQQGAGQASAMSITRPRDLQNYALRQRPPPPPLPVRLPSPPTTRRSPSPPPPPPVPGSGQGWSTVGYGSPLPPPAWEPQLFTPEQASRFERHEQDAPWLYSRQGPPSSTSSEEIQAEVQRQLRNFVERHDGEARRLRDEVQQLQQERSRLVWQLGRDQAVEGHQERDRTGEGHQERDRAVEGHQGRDRAVEGHQGYDRTTGGHQLRDHSLQRVVVEYVISLQRVVIEYVINLQRVATKYVISLQRVATKDVISLQRVATKDVISLQRVVTKDVISLQRVVTNQLGEQGIMQLRHRCTLPSTLT